jgi:hypothetical protein
MSSRPDSGIDPGSRLPTVRFVQAGVMLLGPVVYYFVLAPPFDLRSDTYETYLVLVVSALVGWNLLLLIATILAIVNSVLKIRAGKTRELATDIFVVKLASIPFFLINFALLAMLTVMGAVFWFKGGVLLLTFLPLEITLTYLAMLSTSVYGWAAIVQLRRDRVIGTGLTVLYSIMLVVFVTDIAAAILLFGHSRRRPGVALVVVLLLLGVALAVPSFLTEDIPWLGITAQHIDGLGIAGIVLILATIVVAITRSWRLRRRVASDVPSEDEQKAPV